MKPMNARQAEAHLRAHGFIRSHGVGSHRGWFNPVTNRYVVVPHHGNKTLPQGTLNAIFDQAGIPKPPR
jgi:predicted RNA binding protein YcfA (HicA-like mRNA interferase family)